MPPASAAWARRSPLALRSAWVQRAGLDVKIADAERGGRYECIKCGKRMTAKKGFIRQWHFAHVVKSKCEPNLIHDIAVRHIVAGLLSGTDYEARYECEQCGHTATELLTPVVAATPEQSLAEHTLADIRVVPATPRAPFAIEVINTSDRTAGYAGSRVVVYRVWVMPETVGELDTMLHIGPGWPLNLPCRGGPGHRHQ